MVASLSPLHEDEDRVVLGGVNAFKKDTDVIGADEPFARALLNRTLLYDGSKGFLLSAAGLGPGETPDLCNITRPSDVLLIHKAYVRAGSDAIQTNTLTANRIQLKARGLLGKLTEINRAGANLAFEGAARQRGASFVVASVGPTGETLSPAGTMSFRDATESFDEHIGALVDAGVDAVHLETFTSLAELRAAALAARRYGKPVIATLAFGARGATMMGERAAECAFVLEGLGACCVGFNCGLKPLDAALFFADFGARAVPLCAKPDAGKPEFSVVREFEDGVSAGTGRGGGFGGSAGSRGFAGSCGGGGSCGVGGGNREAEALAAAAGDFARMGARLIGGCCGFGPEHIAPLREIIDGVNERERAARLGRGAACDSQNGAAVDGDWRVGGRVATVGSMDFTGLIGADAERSADDAVELMLDASENFDEIDAQAARGAQGTCGAQEARRAQGVRGDKEAQGAAARGARGACLAILPPDARVAAAVAENARACLKRPVVFSVGAPGSQMEEDAGAPDALFTALERYCGRAAVRVPKSWGQTARSKAALYGAFVFEQD